MKKTIIRYGVTSGLLISVFMVISMYLYSKQGFGFSGSMYYGFGTMLVSLSLIYFAIRKYRELEPEKYKYGTALLIGLGVSLVCALMYVISWEIIFNNFFPDFMQQYSEYCINQKVASGESAENIAKFKSEMATQSEMYKQPLYRIAFTFVEIFPMGLLVSLVSPLLVRKRK